MKQVYVVRNQEGYFATRKKEWECGREPKLLFRSEHKDEAINLVFELSSKDIYLRAEAIAVDLNDDKQPVVEVTAAPRPKPAAEDEQTQPLFTAEGEEPGEGSNEGADEEPDEGSPTTNQTTPEAADV